MSDAPKKLDVELSMTPPGYVEHVKMDVSFGEPPPREPTVARCLHCRAEVFVSSRYEPVVDEAARGNRVVAKEVKAVGYHEARCGRPCKGGSTKEVAPGTTLHTDSCELCEVAYGPPRYRRVW